MKKSIPLFIFGVPLFLSMLPQNVYAQTFPLHKKEIVVNGQVQSEPYGVDYKGTTYMPLWDLMNVLAKLQIRNSWSGTVWSLRTTSQKQVLYQDISKSSGDKTFDINGVPVVRTDTIVVQSSVFRTPTQYVPIWYLMETLRHLDIQSYWDGRRLNIDDVTPNTKIKHLIVIVQENHSFDNYFGTYPNSPGFQPLPNTPKVDGIPSDVYNLDDKGLKVYPYLLTDSTLPDIPHGYLNMLYDWDNGRMDNFVKGNILFLNKHRQWNGIPDEPMGYYDYRTVEPYWGYAQHFTLADHWFTPVFGPTSTNMLYFVAGRAGDSTKTVYYTTNTQQYDFTFRNIGDEMGERGVSWTWYQGRWDINRPNIRDNPFMFFENYKHGNYNGHIKDMSQFELDLRTNQLPDVAYLKVDGEDEHPGFNVKNGIDYVTRTVDAIEHSPYWDSTAIILTYDESGGWYDHVAPPQTGENVDGLQGDGPRVPTLILSPYAKHNYVSHDVYTSASVLKFMEYNWGLRGLTKEDEAANNLLDFFNSKIQ